MKISDPTKIQLLMPAPTHLDSPVSDPPKAGTKHLGPLTQKFPIRPKFDFSCQRRLTSSYPSLTLQQPATSISHPSMKISDSTKIQLLMPAPTHLDSPVSDPPKAGTKHLRPVTRNFRSDQNSSFCVSDDSPRMT